jgi:hypothetical protein
MEQMRHREGEFAAHERPAKIRFELVHPLLERVLALGLHAHPGRGPSGAARHESRQGAFKRLAAHRVQARRTNAKMLAGLLDGHLARERGEYGAQALFQICGPFDAIDMSEPDGRTPQLHRITSADERCVPRRVRQAETAAQDAPGRAISTSPDP